MKNGNPELSMRELVKSRWRLFQFFIAGFMVMLLICCLYLWLGANTLGRPTERWAEIFFYLGVYAGEFLFSKANFSIQCSIWGGVLVMSLIGCLFRIIFKSKSSSETCR